MDLGTEEVQCFFWVGEEVELVSSSVLYCCWGNNYVKRLENLPLNSKYFLPTFNTIFCSLLCSALFSLKTYSYNRDVTF